MLHQLTVILLLFSFQTLASAEEYQCPCPEVGVIDQAGIQNLEYGRYLRNRVTTAPKVTVTRNCEIFADVTGLDIDNHLLMAFREGAQPIFAARLTSSSKTIQLLNIQCIKNGCDHEWQYYNGTVNNLTLAVQQDEPRCNCDFSKTQSNASMWFEANMATCDDLVFNCTGGKQAGLYQFDDVSHMTYERRPNGMKIDDLTCVSQYWWYNGVPSAAAGLFPRCDDLKLNMTDCGCVEMIQYGVYPEPDSLDTWRQFTNWTLKSSSAVYNGCSADLKCFGTDTLAIFSGNYYKALIYPPGKSPKITCDNSPMSTSPDSPKFWFVDGRMLSNAHFGCYAPP